MAELAEKSSAGDTVLFGGATVGVENSKKRPPLNLQRAGTLGNLSEASKLVAKKHKKKLGTLTIVVIVVIVVVVVVGGGAAAAVIAMQKASNTSTPAVEFGGEERTASVAGAAMSQGGRQSLVPSKEFEDDRGVRRRLDARLEKSKKGTLGKCPRDSQVIIEYEATPISVYDGTAIFTTVDQILCLMALTKPSVDQTVNQGAYTAIVNENFCMPTQESSQGGAGGGGVGGQGSTGAQVVSLKTMAVNSTRPTIDRPDQPFSVKMILPFTSPTSSDGTVSKSQEMLMCFAYTAWVYDNITSKFTDYELTFATCEEKFPLQVVGTIREQAPDPALIDLSQMHALLDKASTSELNYQDWTDMSFKMMSQMTMNDQPQGPMQSPGLDPMMGGPTPAGPTQEQQGRSVYEKYEAVGCAKANDGYGPNLEMCFDGKTLKNKYGSGSSVSEKPACKSRKRTFELANPQHYRAYKLCDDDACSGSHDCKESGPVNNVNFYTCKPGTEEAGKPGCSYDERLMHGYMYIYSADYGAQMHGYPAHAYEYEAPSPPPPPPAPPPEQQVPYTDVNFPDGTKVWRDSFMEDDKQYTIRRMHGRLVHVKQDSMLLCDMPGTYTIAMHNDVQISFEADAVGSCSGGLKERIGVEVGDTFMVRREHLDRNLRPDKPQYVMLKNGASGGAGYRLPIQTEYWQLITIDGFENCLQAYSNQRGYYCVSDPGFKGPNVPLGTKLDAYQVYTDWISGYWDANSSTWVSGYYVEPEKYSMTVAATTYALSVVIDHRELFEVEKADIEADPECAPCPDGDPMFCNLPSRCYRLNCVTHDGENCGIDIYNGLACDYCSTYYPSYLRPYQKFRVASDNSSMPGNITAELVAEHAQQDFYDGNTWLGKNVTLIVQCMVTTGDAKSASGAWTPSDVSTNDACGLIAGSGGQWLRGPMGNLDSSEYGNVIFGRIESITNPKAILVTSSTTLPYYMKLNTSVMGIENATDEIDLKGIRLNHREWNSFPGKVVKQPRGDALVNYTIKAAVSPGTMISGLRCVHNCIDPTKMGTTESPPQNKSVVFNEDSACISTPWHDCNAPDRYAEIKVPMNNYSFQQYEWQTDGLHYCDEAGCTKSVAVPSGTVGSLHCYQNPGEEERCWVDQWSVKSTLFVDGSTADFKCEKVAGETDSEGAEEKACLTHKGQYTYVANVDGLSEYYEYHTGVPTEWSSTDTIWMESVEDAGVQPTLLKLEPPLQLTLQVPADEPTTSKSGIDYAGKKFVVQFSNGIDIYNSPGMPMWCLNRESGRTKEPITDDNGYQACMDWENLDMSGFVHATDYFELYPDINPDLHWEGHDGLNRMWGLKPAEKTVLYREVPDEECEQNLVNPVTLDMNLQGDLAPVKSSTRAQLTELQEWYALNRDVEDVLKVHTTTIIGEALPPDEVASGSEEASGSEA